MSGNPTGKQAGDLGRGSGAMRPAQAAFGPRIAAVWLDKRDFLSGYDVYAALTEPGSLRFAKDAKAQDSFGDAIAQWHAAVAGNARGELVNSYGEVFAALLPETERSLLPLLYGPQGTAQEVLKHYGDFIGAFKAVGEMPVQVTLSPRLAWQLKLQNGMLVDIGREQQKSPVGVRLARFIEIYQETVAKRAVRPAVVDLRYPNGFAMRIAGEAKGK